MDEVVTQSIGRPRLLARLLAGFAALALVLAANGTYGVLWHMVTAGRRELGIRLALGADRRRLPLDVMRQGLTLASAGAAVGLAGALGLNRFMVGEASLLAFCGECAARTSAARAILDGDRRRANPHALRHARAIAHLHASDEHADD